MRIRRIDLRKPIRLIGEPEWRTVLFVRMPNAATRVPRPPTVHFRGCEENAPISHPIKWTCRGEDGWNFMWKEKSRSTRKTTRPEKAGRVVIRNVLQQMAETGLPVLLLLADDNERRNEADQEEDHNDRVHVHLG